MTKPIAYTRKRLVIFWGKGRCAQLTVGHESHDGMRGATEVGRGTFVGYHPEQSDRPVGGEPEHSSQSQDPQLSKQARSEMGSLHLTLSVSNYTDSTQSKRKRF